MINFGGTSSMVGPRLAPHHGFTFGDNPSTSLKKVLP